MRNLQHSRRKVPLEAQMRISYQRYNASHYADWHAGAGAAAASTDPLAAAADGGSDGNSYMHQRSLQRPALKSGIRATIRRFPSKRMRTACGSQIKSMRRSSATTHTSVAGAHAPTLRPGGARSACVHKLFVDMFLQISMMPSLGFSRFTSSPN
jgi:hypothetical protein